MALSCRLWARLRHIANRFEVERKWLRKPTIDEVLTETEIQSPNINDWLKAGNAGCSSRDLTRHVTLPRVDPRPGWCTSRQAMFVCASHFDFLSLRIPLLSPFGPRQTRQQYSFSLFLHSYQSHTWTRPTWMSRSKHLRPVHRGTSLRRTTSSPFWSTPPTLCPSTCLRMSTTRF